MASKKVIYLDQNFVSDMAKLSLEEKKDKVDPQISQLFDTIKSGVDIEAFIVPDSSIQALETAQLSPEWKQLLRQYQGYLGQLSFRPIPEIKQNQFTQALLDYHGIERPSMPFWQGVFDKNPDARLENYKITADSGFVPMSDGRFIDAVQQVRDKGVNEGEQYQKEVQAQREHYKKLIRSNFGHILRMYHISVEQADAFIDSEEFAAIPNIDIFSKLWAKSLSDKMRKKRVGGDLNDIDFLSAFLPYCDFIGADSYMKTAIQQRRLDVTYECKVFSMKKSDLQNFVDEIDHELQVAEPANTNLFSVVCIMDEPKPAYQVQFLQKLNLARNKFLGTGKYWNQEVYTSVFFTFPNTSDVELPDPSVVAASGFNSLTHDQLSTMFIFQANFDRLEDCKGMSVEEIIAKIPEHLRGEAIAVIPDNTIFDQDVREHDSYLFFDIEEAIKGKLACTNRYKIQIIYPEQLSRA